MKNQNCLLFIIFLLFLSCYRNTETNIVNEWIGKEIQFPNKMIFTSFAKDTVNFNLDSHNYRILVYVDSIGCSSCKFRLPKWRSLMKVIDSISNNSVSYLFDIHPQYVREMNYILVRDNFDFPICIDTKDSLNKLNHFPSNIAFQTFLLDKDNRVVLIGNPVYNPAIKELYLKQITGNKTDNHVKTTAIAKTVQLNMGVFTKNETKKAYFDIENTGKNPLVIVDVSTTCGCTIADFDRNPAQPGKTLKVSVAMSPKAKGFFDERVTVYCNTTRPIVLDIKGDAK